MPKATMTACLEATRPAFLTAILWPVLIGAAIAAREAACSVALLLLACLAALSCAAAINVLNDCFDHINGCDDGHPHPLTPFTGGSRLIQQGRLSLRQMQWLGYSLLLLCVLQGLVLVWFSGPLLFWIGLFGVVSGTAYSAPPLALNYRGLGELLVGLNFGVLAVLGSAAVHTDRFLPAALHAGIPVGLLAAAILLINEFPDQIADRKAGKRTLVLIVGQQWASRILALLFALAFLVLLIGVLTAYLPVWSLLGLLAMPFALMAVLGALRFDSRQAPALLPAIKSSLATHALVSASLLLAFLLPENT